MIAHGRECFDLADVTKEFDGAIAGGCDVCVFLYELPHKNFTTFGLRYYNFCQGMGEWLDNVVHIQGAKILRQHLAYGKLPSFGRLK